MSDIRLVPVVVAITLFYIGGMFLNDAFDHKFDLRDRPDRPIPSGAVSLSTVFCSGFGLLAMGLVVLAGLWIMAGQEPGIRVILAGITLCALIIFYDFRHKMNAMSPLVMGACRVLVYVTAAAAIVHVPTPSLIWGSIGLLGWLIGLTYLAKQEAFDRVGAFWPLAFLAVPFAYGVAQVQTDPAFVLAMLGALAVAGGASIWLVFRRKRGDVGQAVTILISSICLVDGLFLVISGHSTGALIGVVGFALTLALQRFVPGT